ncbi:Short-chain dehydrogenase, associated with 2-hydroxychromene-2-carboxylate isomerase family protein [Brevundimonas diminuta 3F5N]|uniref:Short-chain dehydrogenase, associated with 2-hydroxychromene-2-carboxylate isomerase family protein n=1 Tax=Brevundimonas diminuta 3F5N TaxID=1255603 RepID=A0A1R4G582_BREDI|nr:SDR family NAD(P)-dependent oxidoreductase [Brevundimonas diminuta]SJM63243.1 Short-chain dehydrogenase, associated with 2-hydroxychromene-2-carboxylate isomerase family protein [Brevundimonas diminuta 3F5N]
MNEKKKVCAVIGVGPGNGAALARRFAADGYALALMARSTKNTEALAEELADARSFACDVGDAASVAGAFAAVRAEMGEVDVVVFNAGSGVFGALDDVSAADFEASWRVNSLGLFLVAKEVTPAMKAAGEGAIIVIGATASRRGTARTTAFAPAKAAQRSLCEALARQLGPDGIHVALIILDGVVDLPRTREVMKDKSDDFFIKPSGVADLASMLVRQDRSAWTFEAEARPFGETW